MNDRAQAALARRERASAIRAAAERINSDLTAIPRVLQSLETVLVASHRRTLNRDGRRSMAADLLVARELRRTVFVAVGHRFAMALLPQVIDLLAGGLPPPIRRSPSLPGARGRMFYGDQATFVATMCELLAPARERMFADWTPAERDAVLGAVRRLSAEVRRRARHTHCEEFGDAWTGPEAVLEPYLAVAGDHRPHRSRTLTFLAEHLSGDLAVSLRSSELGQAEHLAVGLADLDLAFDAAGCPAAERPAVALTNLWALSALAALRDEVAERIVFGPDHQQLYRVDRVGDRWSVAAVQPPLHPRIFDRAGRCPAVDALTPVLAEHRALVRVFRELLGEATGGFPPEHLTGGQVSAADVSSAYAVGVAAHLAAS